MKFTVNPIGMIHNTGNECYLEVDHAYRPAMLAMNGFAHLNVIWWFSDFDDEQYRKVLETPQPYKKAPERMGIFATRSPIRPNPIALTTVEVLHIDYENGKIYISYIDANDGTPMLDIKPYTPSFDRIEHPQVPNWCVDWPNSVETSEDFAWEDVFNF